MYKYHHFHAAAAIALLFVCTNVAFGQRNRINRPINIQDRSIVPGNIHPKARAEYDQGPISPGQRLRSVTLAFAQTDAQQADLDQLLKAQQTPGSADYHHWLTPEQFADRFGVSPSDLSTISNWLQDQGLTIAATANGRNWVTVSGTAAQVENAFQTEIRSYSVEGETHFANSTEPSVPSALRGLIKGFHGLNDFRPKPSVRVHPDYTNSSGVHSIAPNDFTTIYNINPLYTAGFDGSGQKLVVVGQTAIALSDIEVFRSTFGLPANDPQVVLVPFLGNPGTSTADLPEADLDLEWAGAVARKAQIIYVYSADVTDAQQYAIDQNLAPVLSMSYGICELAMTISDATLSRAQAQQATAQGITWVAAAGDAGAADCNSSTHPGLAVDVPASIPEVTGMGGTTFTEGSGSFWNSINDSTGKSVLTYIPETAWNDGVNSASGGGASVYFSKPSWQTGVGVPADNARHVPDLAFAASPSHDGYRVYTGGSVQIYGGTSVPAPSFAGTVALLNQYLVSNNIQANPGLGNVNPRLYALGESNPDIFHDVTTGDNKVPTCPTRACASTTVGYSAGVGYDQVTGLGSIDVYKLITAWSGTTPPTLRSTSTVTLLTNLTNIGSTSSVVLVATVTGPNGTTPSGSVTFTLGSTTVGSAVLAGANGQAVATLTVLGSLLPVGSGTITATYVDSVSAVATASVNISVSSSSASGTPPSIGAPVSAASYQFVYSPGMIMAIFGTNLATTAAEAGSLPLPVLMSDTVVTVNGIIAPLYYVSPLQINAQIPYENMPNGPAVIVVNHAGLTSSYTVIISSAAPGIFINTNDNTVIPNPTASRGQIISAYTTGSGALSPALETGAGPDLSIALTDLPKPILATSITVGGVAAAIDFIGDPYLEAGVVLINFKIPATVPLGQQPVVVTVGSASSAPAFVTITN